MSASRCHHGHQKAPQMYVIALVFAIIANTLCTCVADGDCTPSESPLARIGASIGERKGANRQPENLCPRLRARSAVRVALHDLSVLIDGESTPATWKNDATEVTSRFLPCGLGAFESVLYCRAVVCCHGRKGRLTLGQTKVQVKIMRRKNLARTRAIDCIYIVLFLRRKYLVFNKIKSKNVLFFRNKHHIFVSEFLLHVGTSQAMSQFLLPRRFNQGTRFPTVRAL